MRGTYHWINSDHEQISLVQWGEMLCCSRQKRKRACASGNFTGQSWEDGYLIICDPIISKSISYSVCSEGTSMANKMEGSRMC